MESNANRWLRLHALACMSSSLMIALAGCGGGSGAGGSTSPPPTGQSTLKTAAEGEVLAYFKARIQQRATQGMDGTAVATTGIDFAAVTAANAAAPETVAGTLLQEQGVDEDDRLKTDGTMLYALQPSQLVNGTTVPERLTAARILADGKLQDVGSVTLPTAYSAAGLYLAQDAGRLAVLSQLSTYATASPATNLIAQRSQTVAVDVYRAATGAAPSPLHHVEIDGWMVGSRRIGNVLYIVSSWVPELSGYQVPANSPPEDVQRTLSTLTAEALMPKVRMDNAGAQPLVRESDCYLQPANASLGLQLTTITAFDLSSPTLARSSRCFVGDGNAMYMSRENVYLASSQQVWIAAASSAMVFPSGTRTDLHKFALQGMQVDYRGSGQVPGHLGWDAEKIPSRMGEHAGDLRVLSFTGETGWSGTPTTSTITSTQKPSPATLTVFRENTSTHSLQVIGQLPNAQRPVPIGKAGEQVYAVHFAGPRGYVVTFRRIDPLYVLDLSTPTDPRTAGELEMSGYSDYLYPLGGGSKLLGIGRDASAEGVAAGLKVALMDVADPAQPRLLASRTLGQRGTMSTLDYSRHGINILEQGTKAWIALPVLVTESDFRASYQGLARWEADTNAGTLVERPLILATRFTGTSSDSQLYQRFRLAQERSAQSARATYYLSGGTVTATLEP